MSKHPDVRGFFGPYRFLSSFHLATVMYEDDLYASNEHAFQAAKKPDRTRRGAFLHPGCSPRDAKQLGGAPPLQHPNWFEIRVDVMCLINCYKYNPKYHPDLAERLLMTEDAYLEETNSWHDNFWGNCECGKRESCKAPGENQLGKILMQIRSALQQDSK